METQTYNPWRINKEGNVIIPSYMYWRQPLLWHRRGLKLQVVSSIDFSLEHAGLLYNSKGDVLYWPNFENFDHIPKFISCFDCEDTPAFAHFTERRVEQNFDFFEREKYNPQPLKLEIVKSYFADMVKATSDTLKWSI